MNTKLHHLKFVCLLLLLFVGTANAQINYSEDFETGTWESEDFAVSDIVPCNGSGSLRGNPFEIFGFSIPAEVISPSLGTSDGSQLILNYSYKLLNYATTPDTPTENSPSWGQLTVEYSASADGPWTLLETISPDNHVVSDVCAVRTIIFTPPAGSEVFLRFNGTPATGADFFIYLDDISAQASPACAGIPAASVTVAENTSVCLNQNVELSLSPLYTSTGITYQWQSSADGIAYTNVATGGDMATYSAAQTQTTWYRAVITCANGGQFIESTPVQVTTLQQICYCDVELSNAVEPITLVNFAGINNITSAEIDATPALEDFTALPPANVVQGGSYPIVLKANTGGDYTSYFTVFIDFNHDGDFDDANESFEAGTVENSTGEDGAEAESTIQIPADALVGPTRMRVIKLDGAYAENGCTDENFFFGQAEDYTLQISVPTGCSTAPAAANIIAEDTTICGTATSDLSLSLNYDQTGITYQWQSSADGVTFTDISGADDATYTISNQAQTTWYRAVVICSNGNLSTATAPIQIFTTTPQCYCEVEFESGVEPMTYLNFGTLENNSSADPDASEEMEDFTSINPPVVEQGGSYPIMLGGNTVGDYENFFTVYFDWNHDGDLDDAGEMYEIGSITNSTGEDDITAEGTIAIPANATLGNTFMRVIKLYDASPVAPCGDEEYYSYGQVEDYLVFVDVAAGTGSFNMGAFRYHPNPVKDVLNLSYTENISSVQIYNLVGQQVLAKNMNAASGQIDMSAFAAGAYIVKVNTKTGSASIKVVKH